MTTTVKKDAFTSLVEGFESFARERAAFEGEEFTSRRRLAMSSFEEQGLPVPRAEAWKYLDLSALRSGSFEVAEPGTTVMPAWEGPLGLPDLEAYCLVLLDGGFVAERSRIVALPAGLQVLNLEEAWRHGSASAMGLGQIASHERHPFTALNTATFRDGVLIRVASGCVVEKPVYIVHLSGASKRALMQPRVFVDLGEQAELHLIEDFCVDGQKGTLVNSVVEFDLGKASTLRSTKLLRNAGSVSCIARTAVRQDRDSHFEAFSVVWDGELVRQDLTSALSGVGASCSLYGLNYLTGSQVADDHTSIRHEAPHCTSHEDYRSILADRSEGVFNGEIFVAPKAQKTYSEQSSRNLLLSKSALMNTKPELQILADDVKCSHGATVGQLEEAALFYLRSRGIPRDDAVEMLKRGFAEDILEKLRPQAVAELVGASLRSKGGAR